MPKLNIPEPGQPAPAISISKMQRVIIHNGREYVSTTKYSEHLGDAGYYASELQNARRDGLPHLPVMYRGKIVYFYNLEDCRLWHLGVA